MNILRDIYRRTHGQIDGQGRLLKKSQGNSGFKKCKTNYEDLEHRSLSIKDVLKSDIVFKFGMVTKKSKFGPLTLGNQTSVQRVISLVRVVYPRVTIVTLSVNGNGIILGM